MTEFDDKLRRALRRDDSIQIGADEIGTARGLVTEVFRFRSKLIAVASIAKVVIMAVLAVVFAAMAFASDDARGCTLSAFLSLACLIGLSSVWQFHWMLLNRNAVLRELKRLQLQQLERDLGPEA